MTVVIAGYARTPFVRYTGLFASEPASHLGAHAVSVALERAGVRADAVDQVFAGQGLMGGAGQNPGRQAAVRAGIPLWVPAMTLNIVCLSGIEAVVAGAQAIERGDADVVVAVGQESMSLAPHAVRGSRLGVKYGAMEVVDLLEHDGLRDAFDNESMGALTERRNESLGIDRAVQDEVAFASHRNAVVSRDFLAGEIAPYRVPSRQGEVVVDRDDGVREGTSLAALSALRPSFSSARGTITAGNSSQLSDGAAALVLMSDSAARDHDVTPIAEIVGRAVVAGPDTSLHAQPAQAISAAIARTGLAISDLRAVEINEAFAAVVVQSARVLGVPPEIVNPNGGAIALGHPLGASGARVVGTLARQLHRLGDDAVGAAALCGGGGQGSAVILRSRPGRS